MRKQTDEGLLKRSLERSKFLKLIIQLIVTLLWISLLVGKIKHEWSRRGEN